MFVSTSLIRETWKTIIDDFGENCNGCVKKLDEVFDTEITH